MLRGEERRAAPRARLDEMAALLLGPHRVDAHCLDISLCGLGVLAPRAVDPGTYLRLNLEILGSHCLTIDGLVVRAQPGPARAHRIGIAFTVLEAATAGTIAGFIARARSVAVVDTLETSATRRYLPIQHVDTRELPPVSTVHSGPARATRISPRGRRS